MPKVGKFRTAKLRAELDATKIFDDICKKDRIGCKRRLSFDHVFNAPWAKAEKRLEEIHIIKDEFIADRPKKYKPKYKTRKRKIKYIEPKPPALIPTPKNQDVAILEGLRKSENNSENATLDNGD